MSEIPTRHHRYHTVVRREEEPRTANRGKDVTYDLRPDRDPSKAAGTTGMTEAIVAAMA